MALIVHIHGTPNSGKNTLKDAIARMLAASGIASLGREGDTPEEVVLRVENTPGIQQLRVAEFPENPYMQEQCVDDEGNFKDPRDGAVEG